MILGFKKIHSNNQVESIVVNGECRVVEAVFARGEVEARGVEAVEVFCKSVGQRGRP